MSGWRGRLAQGLDALASGVPPLEDVYLPLRAQVVLRKYRRRRERYATACRERGLAYSEAQTLAQLRQRLRARGYHPAERALGEVHTFAFIPRIGWHGRLLQCLRELGPVTEFDYAALGYRFSEFQRGDTRGVERRREMNEQILPALEAAHRLRPVDWVFVYASGAEISASVIEEIQRRLGMPTVNMCLDDKHSWEGRSMGDHRAGQIDIAAVFDLSWTSARVACEWYLVEGGRPLYLPPGCDAGTFSPRAAPQDLAVSFVGQRYGFRASAIRFLRRRGVDVNAFGHGWPEGPVPDDRIAEIFCRSRINLGLGGIGAAEGLTNLKGRDFEVPCAGGGLYLTSFNPDLALHFDVGQEIVCYRSRDEMLELIRHYLAHPDEARCIALAGRRRCMREHLWVHRFTKVGSFLGILRSEEAFLNAPQEGVHAAATGPCAE